MCRSIAWRRSPPKCKVSRAACVDSGRIVTAAASRAAWRWAFHLLPRRAAYDEKFISEVARVMEYSAAYEIYRNDREPAGLEPDRQRRAGTALEVGAEDDPPDVLCRLRRLQLHYRHAVEDLGEPVD